jgi:hypothetical protein
MDKNMLAAVVIVGVVLLILYLHGCIGLSMLEGAEAGAALPAVQICSDIGTLFDNRSWSLLSADNLTVDPRRQLYVALEDNEAAAAAPPAPFDIKTKVCVMRVKPLDGVTNATVVHKFQILECSKTIVTTDTGSVVNEYLLTMLPLQRGNQKTELPAIVSISMKHIDGVSTLLDASKLVDVSADLAGNWSKLGIKLKKSKNKHVQRVKDVLNHRVMRKLPEPALDRLRKWGLIE